MRLQLVVCDIDKELDKIKLISGLTDHNPHGSNHIIVFESLIFESLIVFLRVCVRERERERERDPLKEHVVVNSALYVV